MNASRRPSAGLSPCQRDWLVGRQGHGAAHHNRTTEHISLPDGHSTSVPPLQRSQAFAQLSHRASIINSR